MSVFGSRVSRHVDAASQVALRSLRPATEAPSPVTETTLAAAVPLQRLAAALPGLNAEVASGVMEVCVFVESLNLSTNTYTLEFLTDTVESMDDDPVTLGSVPLSEVGQFVVGIDSGNIRAGDAWLACRLVVAGTPDSPSIDYAAWISGCRAA